MSVPGPVLGPCASWISGDDVAACCSIEAGTDPTVFDEVAVEASMVLYELTGKQFSGLCENTVRPCREGCGCWFFARPWLYWNDFYWWGGETIWDNYRERCGCGVLHQVKLAGYPVREIEEVKIDGDVIDPSTYRLDRWRYLVRLDDPGPPVRKRRWPSCQNLALDDTEPSTFSITYSFGVDPPLLGINAAAELACQLYRACPGVDGGDCNLPAGVTRVERQGLTFDREQILGALSGGNSGLLTVDTFLTTYGGRRRPAAVWSPDRPSFPRRVG